MRLARTLLVLVPTLLLPLIGCATAPSAAKAPVDGPRSVVCVRHAEKQSGDDPALTPAGQERAEALARLLAAGDVTHLFASQYRRTRETLAPLSAATGLAIEGYDAGDLEGLVERLDALPIGSVAVVAGHSNTVPPLVRALGGDLRDTSDSDYGEVLADNAHDRAFLVLRGGSTTVVELQYGVDG
ncbi:MAG: histidine phosphatase family protein [Planctomycetota bacterium]